MAIEVGDLVRLSQKALAEIREKGAGKASSREWSFRALPERTYIVVSQAWYNPRVGDEGLVSRMIEVLPPANRHNPRNPDEFVAMVTDLELVTKASYNMKGEW